MCVEMKNKTNTTIPSQPQIPIQPSILPTQQTISPIPQIIPPTPQIIPPTLPTLPKLQLDPILGSNGIPIANQEWSGTEYVRTNDPTKFIVITKTLDPKIARFLPTFKKPVIIDIINKTSNSTLDMNKIITTNNFNVENAKALANFGNSCYFGTSMQLLFVMFHVRNFIVKNSNFTETGISINLKNAYDSIKNLFITMNTAPKNDPIKSFPDYPNVKKQIMKEPDPVQMLEEDAEEFITQFMSDLDPKARNLALIKGNEYIYDVSNAQLNRQQSFSNIFNLIPLDIIKSNPTDTLENILSKTYTMVELREGVNTIQNPITSDYEFTYFVNQPTILPEYFLVRLNMVDPTSTNKLRHNIQINTTLVLTINGQTTTYFALAIIVHRGNSIKTGHYTCLVFDNQTGSQFQYIFYDDSLSSLVSIPTNSKIIPSNLYLKNITDSAYIILYGDITKLR
ncbi:peptidase C19 subfamily protein [Acanthamoeba polyphaga mimivirus]|nr:peptidase C19 subfamily protein [Mimivirus reunion]WMV61647.1 peptidase C19 subfamily protein [Mimivirus sp.]WMV62624.1 peptidase C19 subfamily protein [Acanthamoeba polyphaga mimivirus]WMV63601.1 peptidase C19 subfamily protein [Mimivirus sp.]